jgi:hypothetical protein
MTKVTPLGAKIKMKKPYETGHWVPIYQMKELKRESSGAMDNFIKLFSA